METSDAIGSFLTLVLLAFAGISVFAGAFIILNAFSITVAQRRRVFAILRALGVLVAKAINALFKAAGADIPTAVIALEPRTVISVVLVGVGVTLLSALAPALRATRVPPVAALQERASLPPARVQPSVDAAGRVPPAGRSRRRDRCGARGAARREHAHPRRHSVQVGLAVT